ncbi:MAG: prephenate dehydratase [Acidimicrobiales bacterium]|nr:prephenate dehydratase [Acidimicrobiales bacterium]
MSDLRKIGFLGPHATFTEEALLGEADLASCELIPYGVMTEALAAVERGEVDAAFVPIENAIEGTVNLTLDALIFDHDLLIQREVEKRIVMNLLIPPGLALGDIERVLTLPVAVAQCREWLQANIPEAEFHATNSTADAARIVGERVKAGETCRDAAVGPALSGQLYGLDIAATDIEDHPDNSTRFVLVRPGVIPSPTGHDKTSIVCFQRADVPGSLHGILGQFTARNINLSKLESRPTKSGLGNYCFIIDFEGHIDDEVVFDCLRDLHASLASVKFLGSYPAAGEHGPAIRRDAEASWKSADEWARALRDRISR